MTNSKTKNNILELLANENPVGLFYLKNDIIEYANDAFAEIFKTTAKYLLGKSIFKLVDKNDHPLLSEKISQLKNRELQTFQGVHLKIEGNFIENSYFSLNLKAVSINDGTIEMTGASRLATHRVKIFKELDNNNSKFEVLYKNSIEGILIYNYQFDKIIEANRTALKELGYENDKAAFLQLNRLDLIPKTSDFFPGIDNYKATYNHGKRVMNKEVFYTQGIFLKKNGEPILLHISVVPTLQKIGEAFIIFKNITQEIISKKALKTSEEKYKDIFDNSHEGILYFNLKTKTVEMCNQNALNILGIDSLKTLSNLAAKDFYHDKKIKDVEYTQFTLHTLKKALRNGRTETIFKLKQQTGHLIWVSAVLISAKTNNTKSYIIVFIRNITELYEAQKQLNQKNIELQKYIDSNLQLENFAYLASHDLQTPLRSIISFTQLLQLKLAGKLSSEEKEYMHFIISATKNMKDLVNDLLAYSSVNGTKINLKEIEIDSLVKELLKELNEDIKNKNASIHLINLHQKIKADPIKIKQVFQNLIINAIKFNKKGNSPVVKIAGSENEDSWIFSVSDQGIGIDLAYKDKIFLMFKRLHSKEYEGTGIGLAMVKKIIEQHQGKIWFQSNQNKGTTFSFSIPKFPETPSK